MKYSFKDKELQKTRYPLFKVFPVLLGLVSSWLLCAILTAAANNNSPGNLIFWTVLIPENGRSLKPTQLQDVHVFKQEWPHGTMNPLFGTQQEQIRSQRLFMMLRGLGEFSN